MSIIIDDEWLGQIKSKQAYPIVDKVLFDDEEIKLYVVKPALEEYFAKFPMSVTGDGAINLELILDYPDEYTFGVLDARVVGKGYKGASAGSFWDMVVWNRIGYNTNRAMYNAKARNYNPNGLLQTRYTDQQVINTMINQGTFKYRDSPSERKVYIYSSMSAYYNITWAKYSNDFSLIKFQFRWDVVKLAQAYLLEKIADVGDLAEDSAQEIKIDSSTLREKATVLREGVYTKWNEYPFITVVRQ